MSVGLGNLLTPLRTGGDLASLADMRAVIGRSSDVGYSEPRPSAAWQEGVERFGKLLGRGSK